MIKHCRFKCTQFCLGVKVKRVKVEDLYFATFSQVSERKAGQGSLELHLSFLPSGFSNKHQAYVLLVVGGTFL